MLRCLPLRGLLAAAAFALAGCGGDDGYRFPVHPARGSVLYRGKPAPGAIVRFHPIDPATTKVPDGQQGLPISLTTGTEEDGSFILSSYLADDGIPAGDYAVTVALTDAESDVENGDGKPSRGGPEVAKIYRDRATTPLKATVKPGDNRFTFELQ